MDSAIRTEDLIKRFGRITALDHLNLDIPEGAIYALVGPNGAGKTTAIKILMNIFPSTGGCAEVLGRDSTLIAGRAFTSIGYVSENQELPVWMRVGEFLNYLRPYYPTWDRSRENELVKEFELPLDRGLGKISRGMRMKAALVSSLAYHPKLIVLDEPFSGLDPLVRDQLVKGLQEVASEATILILSHDLAEIEDLASHVGYLEQGRLRFSEIMPALIERFREVELTFDAQPTPRSEWPNSWMHIHLSAAALQFVESQFDQERTRAEIYGLFSNVRDMTFTPMSLRSIFVAMAKSGNGSA